jgi:dTDP-4-dehydrorhamnose 3,5-epimerase
MELIKTAIKDLYIVQPKVHGDQRGWFVESYNQELFLSKGLDIQFVQDNHSYSQAKGTLRGLHFQTGQMSQTKLVRCTRGEIMDVVVDLRKDSPSYLQHFAIALSAENFTQLLVPKGFAHGFITLRDHSEIQYKVDAYYSKAHDSGVLYSDPRFNIPWETYISQPYTLSEKDMNLSVFNEKDHAF